MEQVETTVTCRFCKAKINPGDYFCPNCGKKIREKPVRMGFWAMVWLFGLSIVAPPLNLPLSIKYLKSSDAKAKNIGRISLGISIVIFIVLSWLGVLWAQGVNRQVTETMKQYRYLGW